MREHEAVFSPVGLFGRGACPKAVETRVSTCANGGSLEAPTQAPESFADFVGSLEVRILEGIADISVPIADIYYKMTKGATAQQQFRSTRNEKYYWGLRSAMHSNPSDPINQLEDQPGPTTDSERDLITVALPPFHIVNSCRTLGFTKPLDCYWSEITPDSPDYLREKLSCTCAEYRHLGSQWSGLRVSGAIDVYIHRCLFNEEESSSIYRIGQCPACHTIYWTLEKTF